MDLITTKRYMPWLVASALFMEQLDSTIVNTAIPAMAESLGTSPLSLKAAVSGYLLSLAVCIPISGWLAERFGSRRIFLLAVALFTASSVLCGLAVSSTMLIAARILQGIAAAMMIPVGRIAIVLTFPKGELLRAMNFVIIPALLGSLLGPTVGGLIVHWLSWHYIFFINVPVGLLVLWFARRYMPDYRSETPGPLDVRGWLLFVSGVGVLSWLLEIFGEHQLSTGQVLGLLAVSLALLAGYGGHALRVPFPLLRLALLNTRTFRVSVLCGFITRLGAGGMPFLLPFVLPTRPGAAGLAVWLADGASGRCGHGNESDLQRDAATIWLPPGADRQHHAARMRHRKLRDDRAGHAHFCHRACRSADGAVQLTAICQFEFHGLRRHWQGRHGHGQHHGQHHAADVTQLWAGLRLACHRLLLGRSGTNRPSGCDCRTAFCFPDIGGPNAAVVAVFLDPAPERW